MAAPDPCAVCGCAQVDLDVVEDGFHLLLGECNRCRHRWTMALHRTEEPARWPSSVTVSVREDAARSRPKPAVASAA